MIEAHPTTTATGGIISLLARVRAPSSASSVHRSTGLTDFPQPRIDYERNGAHTGRHALPQLNAIADFAQSFVSNSITANNELCVGSTCVTPAHFQAMVAAANVSQSWGEGSGGSSSDDAQATDTPPIIQVNGANPAIIQVGATYNDLGATITGPQQDLNVGIAVYVNGTEMSPVQIDTSQAATDTIDYVATDQSGLTSTSTRIVIIEPAPAPRWIPIDPPPSTDATSTNDATTTATSTAT